MLLRDLRQRHSGAAVLDDLLPVDIEPRTPDLPTLQLCSPHACLHALDDQAPFKLGDGPDDDNHGATERPARVYVFAEADELHIEAVQVVDDFEKVLHRASNPVER